jgi:hypothetical protein
MNRAALCGSVPVQAGVIRGIYSREVEASSNFPDN